MAEPISTILISLLGRSLWEIGAALGRATKAADAKEQDLTERLSLFTAQTLDSDAVIEAIRTGLIGDYDVEVCEKVLDAPDFRLLVHELLTVRLLEQSEDEELIAEGIRHLVASTNPDLSVDQALDSATAIYNWLDGACSTVVQQLDITDQVTRSSIQLVAGFSSLNTTLKRIAKHVEFLGSQSSGSRRDESNYVQSYLAGLQRRHGVITLPDLEIERKVPIKDIYVEPRLSHEGSRREVPDAETLVSTARRCVVLGQPGGGKSTLAGVLTHNLAASRTAVPFLIVLRKYGKDFDDGKSFVQHVEQTLNTSHQQEPPAGWVERTLENGSAVVIFDGLDELLDASKRREIRDSVEAFVHNYPLVNVLVTSRSVGYNQAPLSPDDFDLATLGEFGSSSVEDYVRKWFAIGGGWTEDERTKRVKGFLKESESVAELRSNPLLLSLMCVLYRGSNYIPESRLALYEECAKLLFKKWDRSRDIHVPLEIGGADIDSSLMHLALWMLEEGHTAEGVTEAALVQQCAEHLLSRRYERMEDAERVAEEFVRFCRGRAWVLAEAGTSSSGEALFTFTHRTFLEYYAASRIARVAGTPEAVVQVVAPRIARAEWDVIGQLVLQISEKTHDSGGDRFLSELLSWRDNAAVCAPGSVFRLNALSFACRSLHYLVPSPQMARTITACAYREVMLKESRQPRRPSVRQWQDNSPLGQVLGAVQPTLGVVADELSTLIQGDLESAATFTRLRNSRVVAIGTFARFFARPSEGRAQEVLNLWMAWALDLFEDFDWQPSLYAPDVPEAGVGLLELGKLDLPTLLRHFDFDAMLVRLDPGDGSYRFSSLNIFGAWLLDRLAPWVLAPGVPEGLLRDLPDAVLRTAFPRVSADDVYGLFGGVGRSEPRSATLDEDCLPGGVLLLCMLWERSAHREDWFHNISEWVNAASSPILRMVAHLVARRNNFDVSKLGGPAPPEAQELGLTGDVFGLLESWASSSFDFWILPAAPEGGTARLEEPF